MSLLEIARTRTGSHSRSEHTYMKVLLTRHLLLYSELVASFEQYQNRGQCKHQGVSCFETPSRCLAWKHHYMLCHYLVTRFFH